MKNHNLKFPLKTTTNNNELPINLPKQKLQRLTRMIGKLRDKYSLLKIDLDLYSHQLCRLRKIEKYYYGLPND
jgi:hypothetical protein